MMQLFYSSSPNVYKVMIALEEMALPYELVMVDLSKGEQFYPERLGGSVAAKVPVLRDSAPVDGGEPVTVFESGAILEYLADRTGLLVPASPRERLICSQWLFWQMANLGPMGGQFWHFHALAEKLAPDADLKYPRTRYQRMLAATWDIMEKRLGTEPFLAGDYSIADIACFPWIRYLWPHIGDDTSSQSRWPNLARWKDTIEPRPGVQRAYERNTSFKTSYGRNERGGVAYPFAELAKNTLVSGT